MQWSEVLGTHLNAAQVMRLGAARIGLVGAGGLGSNCAMLLARCGVRHFVVADPDVVSQSNLNRQFFAAGQVGQPKVQALRESLNWMLAGSEPGLQLEGHAVRIDEDVALFQGCDVVVEAVDDATTKCVLVEALLDAGHTVVSASGMAGWGGDMRRKRLGKLTVVGDFQAEVEQGNPPMAPRVMMAAAMQADEVLWILLPESRRFPSP